MVSGGGLVVVSVVFFVVFFFGKWFFGCVDMLYRSWRNFCGC